MGVAVLTGVGREGQVGEAVASQLARDGWHLVLAARTADQVTARADAIRAQGGSAAAYARDLTDEKAVASVFSRVRNENGQRLQALVHMAGGFAVTGPVADTTLDA